MIPANAQALLESLRREKQLLITPQGMSMWPLITGKRDSVLLKQCEQPPHKGDVALFLTDKNTFFLHRVVCVGKNGCDFLGDGRLTREQNIPMNRIYAVMQGVYHKNRYIDIGSGGYRLYCALWCHAPLIWFRRPLLRLGRAICRRRARCRGGSNAL